MNGKENVLRCLQFNQPERIPVQSWMTGDVFQKYGNDLRYKVEAYCIDFAGTDYQNHVMGEGWEKQGIYTDGWGCVWHNYKNGIIGEVKFHPLFDYSLIATYKPPMDLLRLGWENVGDSIKQHRDRFILNSWSINPFETMQNLVGVEKLFMDLLEEPPELFIIRDMVFDFFSQWLDAWLRYEVDGIVFSDDWGTQKSLLIPPRVFRKFFLPIYKELVDKCKAADKFVFFHSDGNITRIMDDLIGLGIDALNCQLDLLGLEWISTHYCGKVTFWGELDRQRLLPYGTPNDIRNTAKSMRNLLTVNNGGLIGVSAADSGCPCENIIESFKCWND